MSRPLRIEYPGAWYHVMNWGRRGDMFSERMRIISILLSLRGDNLEEIGKEFNITRFSSVSSVVERMSGKVSGDRQLRNCVEEISIVLQMSQE
ncbi:MAG: Transposase, partial [Thermodesulfobacteriota bacterium]|nr:Transposase [Thermodesulfobacteriota bacterium]